MDSHVPFRALREDRHPERKKQVFYDLHVSLDGLAADCAFASDLAHVERRPLGEADRFEKAMECPSVPDKTLRLHLLLHIQPNIGASGCPQGLVRPRRWAATRLQEPRPN